MILNDTAGDPDGLVSTAHALLSPTVEVRGIIGTRSFESESVRGMDAKLAQTHVDALKMDVPVYQGSPYRLTDMRTPIRNKAARAIVREANRTDTDLPLFVTVGGGLTDLASALLIDPSIASKMTLVWIGGAPYPGGGRETNIGIDSNASQVVFNKSSIRIWQVPQNAYAETMVSMSEFKARTKLVNRYGAFIYDQFVERAELMFGRRNLGETWTMGDNPLVVLTALGAWFDDTGTNSSVYQTVPAPRVDANGAYTANPDGRPIRVYSHIDVRMMMEDFYAKVLLQGKQRR